MIGQLSDSFDLVGKVVIPRDPTIHIIKANVDIILERKQSFSKVKCFDFVESFKSVPSVAILP